VVPAALGSPSVGANQLVDLDHGLQFPQNKQQENSITYDPANKVFTTGSPSTARARISAACAPGSTTG
jgi:hypothetical protein